MLNCKWRGRTRLDNRLQSSETTAPNLDKYLYDSNGYPCYYMSIALLNVESIVMIYFSTGTF